MSAATATTTPGVWAGISPPYSDPASGIMYVPASQPYQYYLPQRIPEPRFAPEPGPTDLATTMTAPLAGTRPNRRTRASKPKGSALFSPDFLRGKPLTASRSSDGLLDMQSMSPRLVYSLGSLSLDCPARTLVLTSICLLLLDPSELRQL